MKAAALAAAAILVAGCGSSSSKSSSSSTTTGTSTTSTSTTAQQIPLPKQPLSQYLAQFQATAKSGNCAGFKKLGFSDPCPRLKKIYKGAKVVKSQQFKTGAVADLSNGWGIALNENAQRAWTNSEDFDFRHPTVGTSGNAAAAEAAVVKTFKAIAGKDCATFYKYASTPNVPPSQKQQYCASVFKGAAQRVYAQNSAAKPIPLGGTADIQFFGYFLKDGNKRYYGTFPAVVGKGPHSPPWLALAASPVPLGG